MKCGFRHQAAIVLSVAFVAEFASAQVIVTPGHIRQSARGDAAALRAPGNMVGAGLARLRGDFEIRPLAIREITEEKQPSLLSEVMVEALGTIFQNLNLALVGLQNTIRAQGGRSPVIPSSILPSTGNDTTGGSDLQGLIDQFSGLLGGSGTTR
jgi:hypothetical protein